MELSVFDNKGNDTKRKVSLSDELFNMSPNEHAVYLDVKQYLANQRQGTHKAKERSQLTRSTRKLIRQKGSGGARRGSASSGILRGGARIFGPQPRDYSFKVNKNVKRLARRSVLSDKASKGDIFVLENFDFEVPKTKKFQEIIAAFKLLNKKVLFVLAEAKKNVYLSSRNCKLSNVVLASQLSTYDIIKANKLVIIEGEVSQLEAILNK